MLNTNSQILESAKALFFDDLEYDRECRIGLLPDKWEDLPSFEQEGYISLANEVNSQMWYE